MFNEYLHDGYYPFFTGNREDYYMNIENVVNLILESGNAFIVRSRPCIYKKTKSVIKHFSLVCAL